MAVVATQQQTTPAGEVQGDGASGLICAHGPHGAWFVGSDQRSKYNGLMPLDADSYVWQ